jgi:hypothetical protein
METPNPVISEESSSPEPAEKAVPAPAGNRFKQVTLLVRQKWLASVIEILVIILGVTLSFAVDEWKDEREKRQLEKVYLKSLLSDLREDVNDLNEIIDETRQVIAKAQTLMTVAERTVHDSLNRVQFVNDIKFITKRPNFIANDATFSDLKGSGHLHLLTDFTLKNSLFKYYKRYESIQAVETAERDAVISIMGPYLIRRIGLVRSDSTALSKNGLDAILKESEFGNQMYIRLSNRQELLEKYVYILSLNQYIRRRLEKQIR